MSSAAHKINQLQHNDHSCEDERRHIAVTLTLLLMGMAILVACVFAIRHVLKYETINAVDQERAERYEQYIDNTIIGHLEPGDTIVNTDNKIPCTVSEVLSRDVVICEADKQQGLLKMEVSICNYERVERYEEWINR